MLRTKKQQVSGVKPNSLEQKEGDVWDMGAKLDDSIFHGGWEKAYVSRKQKREERQKYAARVRPDPSACMPHVLQKMSRKELKAFQEADPSLKAAREGAEHGQSVNGVSFVVNHEGILHRGSRAERRGSNCTRTACVTIRMSKHGDRVSIQHSPSWSFRET